MTGIVDESNIGTPMIFHPFRFEVRYFDAAGVEHLYGWTTAPDGGQLFRDACALKGCAQAFVVDRQVEPCAN